MQFECTIRAIHYPVPSATRTGITHTVTEDPTTGERHCTCEASDHPKTAGKCWHLKAAASGAIKPRVRVAPQPSPAPLPTFTRARTSEAGRELALLLDV